MTRPLRRHLPAAVLAVLVLSAAAAVAVAFHLWWKAEAPPPERLFFALRIESGKTLVAKPNLLGEAGKLLSMRLVSPEAPDRVKLSLAMTPERDASGMGYDVRMTVGIPDLTDGEGDARIHLGHGEEKRFLMTLGGLPVTVTVLLMRVDSPEFEAWKDLVTREVAEEAT